MPQILETTDFEITAPDRPHHSRENGGHIVIWPKQTYAHLHEMPVELAHSFMEWQMIVGEAFITVMRQSGLDVVRINYAIFGNWNYKQPMHPPQVHASLYLRTWGEKHPDNHPDFQAFPEALFLPDRGTGYYDNFKPLTEAECAQIKAEILRLQTT